MNTNTLKFQLTGESLYDTFKRNGLNPEKFGIKQEVKIITKSKDKPKVRIKRTFDFNITLSDDLLKFTESFYNQFDELLKEHNSSTVKTFLLSYIAYINDDLISRNRIYNFISKFDNDEKIRLMCWNTFKHNPDRKYEDWHHVGGALSYIMSKIFLQTDDVEENKFIEKNGDYDGIIYKIPNRLKTYIETVINIYNSDGVLLLDSSYNSGENRIK